FTFRPRSATLPPYTTLFRSYFTLTNNSGRSTADDANPRISNRTGHIIRWLEDGSSAATSFQWDIFLLAGGTTGAMAGAVFPGDRSEEHTSELQSRENLVCRL